MVVPGLGHRPGPQQVLGRQDAGVGPASTSSRASSSACGKSRRTWSKSCSTATTVRFLPASGGSRPSGRPRSCCRWRRRARRAARDRRPAAAGAQTARAGTGRRTACRSAGVRSPRGRPTRSHDWRRAGRPAWRPETTEARPAAEQDGIEHRDREGTIDLRLLGQVGDPLRRALDAAFHLRRQTDQRLQKRALARPVGADDGRHLAGRDLRRHVMDRRVTIVAHGQVGEAQRGVHVGPTAPTRHRATARPRRRPRTRFGPGRSWPAGSCRERSVCAFRGIVIILPLASP